MAVVAYLVAAGGPDYTLNARFSDAGQLVKGDLVEVGGRQIGSITRIGLAPDGEADLTLSIGDHAYVPLHAGTQVTIRQVGLVTVTNRYLELDPGPASAPTLPSGGVLSEQDTHPIVDVDALLDAADPPTRVHFQEILAELAGALKAPVPAEMKTALAFLDPAVSQVGDLASAATFDQPALVRLLASTASVSGALAAHPDELSGAVSSTAATLRELAAERAALADLLDRTSAVLGHADLTLRATRAALGHADPLLADLAPVAPPAARLLAQLVPLLANTAPAVSQVNALMTASTPKLEALPAAAAQAVPAIRSSTRSFADVLPILTGFRPYSADLVAGFFNGFGGSNAGYYDANGHYARIALELGPGSGIGLLSAVPPPQPPQYDGYQTGLTARCPGAASEPADSGFNPWPIPGLCDPAESPK